MPTEDDFVEPTAESKEEFLRLARLITADGKRKSSEGFPTIEVTFEKGDTVFTVKAVPEDEDSKIPPDGMICEILFARTTKSALRMEVVLLRKNRNVITAVASPSLALGNPTREDIKRETLGGLSSQAHLDKAILALQLRLLD